MDKIDRPQNKRDFSHVDEESSKTKSSLDLGLHAKIARLEEEKALACPFTNRTIVPIPTNTPQSPPLELTPIEIKVEGDAPLESIFSSSDCIFNLIFNDISFQLEKKGDPPSTQRHFILQDSSNQQPVYLRMQLAQSKEEFDALLKYSQLFLGMRHASHVIGALKAGVFNNVFVFLSKAVSEVTLLDSIQQISDPFSAKQKLFIFLDIVKGFKELHDAKIIYRNLRPESIIITPQGTALIHELSYCRSTKEEIRDCIGHLPFLAPEVIICSPVFENFKVEGFLKESQTTGADIYSLGLLMSAFFHLEMPFFITDSEGKINQSVLNARLSNNLVVPKLDCFLNPILNSSIEELLTSCLRLNPQERPSADAIIERLEKMVNENFATVKDNQGNIKSLEEISKDPTFSGTITLNGENLFVKRGGIDKKGKAVGVGGFGFLLYVQTPEKSIKEVVKIIPLKKESKENMINSFERLKTETEISCMMIGSDHVLGSNQALLGEEAAYIRMDYMPGGDLLERFSKNISLKKAVKYSLDVLFGLKELHEKNIVYHDLKIQNMVLDQEDNVRIIDFGLAKILGPETKNQQCGGTLRYMAPEVIWASLRKEIPNENHPLEQVYQEGFSFAVDVYSWGVFFSMVLNCTPPILKIKNPESLKERISKSIRTPEAPEKNQNLINLINQCLELEPKNRPCVDDLISELQRVLTA